MVASVASAARRQPWSSLSAQWPMGLVDGSPVGFTARHLGGLSQVQVLKVGVPDVGFNPCTPQGGARGSASPRLWVPCGVWG